MAKVHVSGGAYENEATRLLAEKVSALAFLTLFLLIINTVATLTSPEMKALFDGKFSDVGVDPEEGYELRVVNLTPSIVASSILNLLFFSSIMVCLKT